MPTIAIVGAGPGMGLAIARTFGSSLEVEETLASLVEKVGHLVPFDTCAVYLYSELKGHATVAHVTGRNAETSRSPVVGSQAPPGP